MPSPREQAISIGTEAGKFREARSVPEGLPPQCQQPREQDYRANPTNSTSEGPAPFKVGSQGG